VNQTRNRFGVSLEEAKLIAEKAEVFMNQDASFSFGHHFMIPLYEGRTNHQRQTTKSHSTRLTAFAYEDSDIYLQWGLKAMQNSRIFRMIEEAYSQNAILSASDLCLLHHITAKSIRERLIPLWNQGIRLPVYGMARQYRNHSQFRSTYAVRQFFKGVSLSELQSSLFFSDALWHRWQKDFLQVAWHLQQFKEIEEIVLFTGISLEQVMEYSSWIPQIQHQSSFKAWMATATCGEWTSTSIDTNLHSIHTSDRFIQDLEENHLFSKAKSRLYLQMLDQLKGKCTEMKGKLETDIYYAVSSDESPGKSLDECYLIPIQLTWWTPKDQKTTDLNSTEQLKWQKMIRWATEAHHQEACLNQADLAYLLAIHPSVIQQMMKEHEQILLPTRGNIADMGPGLSHAEKIIELYLQGYTETEIVRRSGHSYTSIENYIMMFSRVVALLERQMPLPLIRQTIGCSLKLVEKHAALYHKYNTPDYQWMLMQIRRIFENNDSKKVTTNHP
jgi:hypothetical protein